MAENAKIRHFLGKNRVVVPVPLKVVPEPIDSMGLVSVPIKVVPVPLLPATLFLHVMQF